MHKKNSKEDIILEFVEAVEKGNFPRAHRIQLEAKSFNECIRRIKKETVFYWKFLASQMIQTSPKTAEDIYRQISKVDPKDHEAYYYLANLLRDKGDLIGAERTFKKAINLAPNEPVYHYFMGSVYWEKGNYKKVEEKFKDSIRADRKFYIGYGSLGGLLCQMGRLEEAEKILKEGIEINPSFAGLKYNLGVVLERQNKLTEAEKAFRDAIKLDFKNPLPHNNIANVLLEQGKEREVEYEYRKAIEFGKGEPRHYLNLIRYYRRNNELDKMKIVLQEMLDNNVIDSNAYDIIGGVLAERNELDKAEIMFRKAIKIDPQNSYPYNNLANSLHKKGNLLEAYELFNEGIKHIGSLPIKDQKQLTTNFAGFLRELGYFYCKQGNHKQTLSVVKKLIEYVDLNKVFSNLKSELLSDAHFLLGLTALKKGTHRNAIQEFQKASNYIPNDARIWYNLAHQFYILGRPHDALSAVNHTLEIKPDYSKANELLEIIKNSKTPRRIKWWRYLVFIAIAGLSVPVFLFLRGFLPWFVLIILLICSVVFLFSPFIKTVKPKFKFLGQELELEIQPPEKSDLKIISIEDRQSLPDEPFKDNESLTP